MKLSQGFVTIFLEVPPSIGDAYRIDHHLALSAKVLIQTGPVWDRRRSRDCLSFGSSGYLTWSSREDGESAPVAHNKYALHISRILKGSTVFRGALRLAGALITNDPLTWLQISRPESSV